MINIFNNSNNDNNKKKKKKIMLGGGALPSLHPPCWPAFGRQRVSSASPLRSLNSNTLPRTRKSETQKAKPKWSPKLVRKAKANAQKSES